jgi:hypothetical protein
VGIKNQLDPRRLGPLSQGSKEFHDVL